MSTFDNWLARHIEHDRRTGTYRLNHAGESLSVSIVTTVAWALDVDPDDLPPLYDIVDPEAIEAAFSPRSMGTPNAQISFDYVDCRVTVRDDHSIVVHVTDES